MPSIASSMLLRLSNLDGEAAAEAEEYAKDAIASVYAGMFRSTTY